MLQLAGFSNKGSASYLHGIAQLVGDMPHLDGMAGGGAKIGDDQKEMKN